MRIGIETRMRTGHVKRWQIVRVMREQTLAEHSYRVFLLTEEICEVLKIFGPLREQAARWALFHDLPEVVTGDIATPAKRALRQVVPAGVADPIDTIEGELDRDFRWARDSVSGLGRTIVKTADLIEAVAFLSVEGLGPHARDVERGLRAAFEELVDMAGRHHPTLAWREVKGIMDNVSKENGNDEQRIYANLGRTIHETKGVDGNEGARLRRVRRSIVKFQASSVGTWGRTRTGTDGLPE